MAGNHGQFIDTDSNPSAVGASALLVNGAKPDGGGLAKLINGVNGVNVICRRRPCALHDCDEDMGCVSSSDDILSEQDLRGPGEGFALLRESI